MKKVLINLVKGSEGYSLQIISKNGGGYRYAGPKAWGNPYNEPEATFEVDLEDIEEYYDKDSCDYVKFVELREFLKNLD